MGIFRRKKENRAEGRVETEGSLLSALLGGGGLITKKEAMEIPALSSCINLIADRLAVLPIKLYKRSGEKPEEIRNDKRVSLLNYDTGDTLNATEMRKRWVRDYFLGKGAYTYIERNSFGEVIGLYYVDEDNVSVISSPDPIHKKYTISVNGRTYFPHEFVKILRNTDGKGKGKSIVEENNTALSVAFNTLKLENTIVRKGGNKRGFIEAERRLSDEAIKAIKEAWRVMYSNTLDNTDNVVVLNDGAKFHESSNSSVEMQLNQNKLSNSNEICKLFCMPPEILTGRASESSVSLFVQNCLTPVINAIEAALDTDLLLEREKGDCYFALDTTELTRGDFTSRMNGYAVALQNNVMQLDEIREREDLPPLGFNYIKLGLQDVLLDPKTMQIYTPNTKELVSLDGGEILTKGGKGDIIEERGNPNHDPKNGQFTSGDSVATQGLSKSESDRLKDELRDKLNKGELSTKLNKYKQGRHIIGNPDFDKRLKDGEFPSYISVSKMEVQRIINEKSLTGQVRKVGGAYHEVITADSNFGICCSIITKEKIKTNRGVIHYSKDGAHLVPTWPEENSNA